MITHPPCGTGKRQTRIPDNLGYVVQQAVAIFADDAKTGKHRKLRWRHSRQTELRAELTLTQPVAERIDQTQLAVAEHVPELIHTGYSTAPQEFLQQGVIGHVISHGRQHLGKLITTKRNQPV